MTTTISETLAALADCGEAYVVGGAVRDMLSGAEIGDVDIAAPGGRAWADAAAGRLGVRAVPIGGGAQIWRLPLEGRQIDVTDAPNGLEADLARRDFTVNAMAMPLADFAAGAPPTALIDPLGGLRDLRAKRLEPASDSAIRDDPVRALRGVRIEAERGLRLTARAEAAIRECAARAAGAPGERIWAELGRIFRAADSAAAARRMEALGLLGALFPELDACRGVDQRPVHRRDVFDHQLDALEWLDLLIAPAPRDDAFGLRERLWAAAGGDARRRIWDARRDLRIATLLHDIGKPATRTIGADGRTRFLGHSELGAALAEHRLRALRAPGTTVEAVSAYLVHHLRPGQIAAPGKPPSERALFRFHRELGGRAAPLVALFLADSLATAGAEALAPRWDAYAAHAALIMQWRPRRAAARTRLLDGGAIMAATGLEPGPAVGRIRDIIDEEAAVGALASVGAARDRARSLAAEFRDGALGAAR